MHIWNSVFTMKGWTVKKYFEMSFQDWLFSLHEKFQVSQSSPSGFTRVKKRIMRFGSKLIKKTRPLIFKIWNTSISMDSHKVHCLCEIERWAPLAQKVLFRLTKARYSSKVIFLWQTSSWWWWTGEKIRMMCCLECTVYTGRNTITNCQYRK